MAPWLKSCECLFVGSFIIYFFINEDILIFGQGVGIYESRLRAVKRVVKNLRKLPIAIRQE